jgi:tetratricopeptide (TPR) repeat protein
MTNIAALLLPFALMQASAEPAAPTASSRFDRCVAAIDSDAAAAYETAMSWAAEGHALDAYRCAALALLAQNRYEEAARRFQNLGEMINPALTGAQAELFSQAGNTWLLAREPSQARAAFTRGIVIMEREPEQLPDLLIDRARAYAMEGDYRAAEEDLSRSIDIRPQDTLALRLRASARMHQNAFDLAETDAQQSLALAATEDERVNAALILGHVRESKRTGTPVEEQ